MKEITTNTNPVLDFGALPYATHARLTFPVTILKGKNPRPLRHITLSELLADIETPHFVRRFAFDENRNGKWL